MANLAGIIHPTAFQITELIGTMSRAFSHTTPFQFFRYKNLELGVWDESFVTNEHKTIWVMVDGTILNAGELRAELKKLGFSFTTENDNELILRAYEAWKESFMSRLNGDFVIILFDEEHERLYIIRDRIGKKNLYWTMKGEYFLFSTEIKGLLATEMVPQTPSTVGLGSYLYFGYIPQDITPIKEVNKLLPGYYLRINLSRQFSIEQYWSLSHHFEAKESLTKEEAYQRFGELFEEGVRTALPKNGIIATLGSDNLGSTALNWQVNKIAGSNTLRSYQASFENMQPEELLADLVEMVWHLDTPIADPYILQTWHLAKMASRETKYVLADLGWQEMLAGHRRYFQTNPIVSPPLAHRLAALLPTKFLKQFLIPGLTRCHLKQQWRILRNIDFNKDQILYLMQLALFKGSRREKVSPLLCHFFDPEIFTQRFHRLKSIPGNVDPFLYLDIKTELPDQLLFQYEQLLAPFGLKLATPFLDYRMVELMAKMPEEIKIEEKTPAAMLRNYLQQVAPELTLPPVKKESLISKWCALPQFRELFTLLEKGLLVEEGLISAKWLRSFLRYPHLAETTFRQFWAILILEIWFRLFIHQPIGSQSFDVDLKEFLRRKM